ncbi:MAG: hypothetical protein RBT34_13315, partial [Anaerolineaceae bacterium]|nr:hypothetical protein [Anaerolineaceae bacterium]
MDNSNKTVSIVVIVFLVLACCILVMCVALAGLGILGFNQLEAVSSSSIVNATPEIVPTVVILPETPAASETLLTLQEAVTPENDLRELAMRLGGKSDIPEVLETEPVAYQLGDQENFWVSDTDTNETFET